MQHHPPPQQLQQQLQQQQQPQFQSPLQPAVAAQLSKQKLAAGGFKPGPQQPGSIIKAANPDAKVLITEQMVERALRRNAEDVLALNQVVLASQRTPISPEEVERAKKLQGEIHWRLDFIGRIHEGDKKLKSDLARAFLFEEMTPALQSVLSRDKFIAMREEQMAAAAGQAAAAMAQQQQLLQQQPQQQPQMGQGADSGAMLPGMWLAMPSPVTPGAMGAGFPMQPNNMHAPPAAVIAPTHLVATAALTAPAPAAPAPAAEVPAAAADEEEDGSDAFYDDEEDDLT